MSFVYERLSPDIDPNVPASARVWNYWLGGKDNYEADRDVGDEVARQAPQVPQLARTSRDFLGRAVTYLAGEVGIRQFLDVGCGLPSADNTHEVAQRVAPSSTVLYVDNDLLVLTHGRALLVGNPSDQVTMVDADLREPRRLLALSSEILDFSKPIGLILSNILGHIEYIDDVQRYVSILRDKLPTGSHVVVSDATNFYDTVGMNKAAEMFNENARPQYHLRSPDEIEGFLQGMELVEPGVITATEWRPNIVSDLGNGLKIDQFVGVARKA